MSSTGSVFVVSAPSGAGKSTLVKSLVQQNPRIVLSISHTTRSPRGNEQHGQAYFFVTEDEFLKKIDQGDFLEWAKVHGHYYGTDKYFVIQQLTQGRDVLMEIDWQGAQQIREHYADALHIFILPPSLSILEQRLTQRGEDSPEVISKRLLAATSEMAQAGHFDYVIVNDRLSEALVQLQSIVTAANCRTKQQRIFLQRLFKDLGIQDSQDREE